MKVIKKLRELWNYKPPKNQELVFEYYGVLIGLIAMVIVWFICWMM